MEDVLLFTAGMLADDERVAAQVRRQYKCFVVDEFQDVSPIQSALLDLWLGGRDELCVVGDPAQTIYSFAGADASYLRDFPAQVPGHHVHRAGPQLPLDARGGRRRQHPAGELLEPRRRAPRPAAAGSRRHLRRQLRRGGRGRGHRHPDRRPARRGSPGGRDRGAVPDQRPVGGLRGRAGGARHPVRRPRRRALLRPARGPAGASPCSAAPPGPAKVATTSSRPCAATLAGMGWSPEAPAARGQTRDRWESLAGARRPGRGVRACRRRRPRRLRRRPRPPCGRAARPGRRRRHPRDPPRRQGPGVGLGVPRRTAGGHAPVLVRRDPGRGRGGAAPALRRHDPRPARPRPVLGARPQPGRAGRPQAVAVPRRPAARGEAGARGSGAPGARSPAAASAASRWPPAPRRSGVAAPAAPRRTTRSCSSACASGGVPRPRTRACRRSWSSPTPPCS